jgi:hypothetical protein
MPMPPVGYEPAVSAGEWLQTHALDRPVTGAGFNFTYYLLYNLVFKYEATLHDIFIIHDSKTNW